MAVGERIEIYGRKVRPQLLISLTGDQALSLKFTGRDPHNGIEAASFTKALASGTRPINPQDPIAPTMTRPKRNDPPRIPTYLSKPTTFVFIQFVVQKSSSNQSIRNWSLRCTNLLITPNAALT